MLEQVQPSDQQLLRDMVSNCSAREAALMMKAFVLGRLGIPISRCTKIVEAIELCEHWVNSDMISSNNMVSAIYNAAIQAHSLPNPKNYTQVESAFSQHLESLLQNVFEDPYYFANLSLTSQPYNHKQEIIMSLNFAENQCSICEMLMDSESAMILDCTHVFHYECLYTHVKTSIENGILAVRCPSQFCGIEMDNHEIDNFMSTELQKKYEDFMMNQYVERNGDTTSWCPTPGCQALFEADSSITDYHCKNCFKNYCLKCRTEQHQGFTCSEYREYNGMNPEDQSFVNFARGAKFKQCPRCKFWVQRNRGCPSMKCRCLQQFCYDCGGVTCPHGSCSKASPQRTPLRP